MPIPTRRSFLARAAAGLLLALSSPAAAQGLDATFELSLRGITGGQIGFKATESDGAYAVTAAGVASGLVGAVVDYRFDGQAEGRVTGGRHVPVRYAEREDDDGEVTNAVTRFRGFAPVDVTFDPPRKPRSYDIEPTAQSGVVDPLTAAYLVLRDTAPAGACNQRYDLFDGRHVSRLTLGQAQAGSDGSIRCAGEYRRIAGYRPDDRRERRVTPLTFVYAPTGDGMVRVTEVRSPTGFGDGVLRRR